LTDGRGTGQPKQFLTRAYQRSREVIHEGAKFLIVGGTGVVVVLVGSDLLHFELGLGKFTSVTLATVVATILAFLGNRYWSFAQRQGAGARTETIMFFLLNGVGLLIQYGSIGLVTDVFGLSGRIWYTVANLVGIGIGTLFRFWSYRKWIWVRPEELTTPTGGRHRKGRANAPANPQNQEHPELTR
jgi:putative flippase GtrA